MSVTNFLAVLIIAVKRFLARRSLIIATVFGVIASITLTLSIPLYADAVYYRIFKENLSTTEEGEGARPPFAFVFHFNGGRYGSVQWEDIQSVDTYLKQFFAIELGLPQNSMTRYVRTEPYRLFAPNESAFESKESILSWVSFGVMEDLEPHITITDGVVPEFNGSSESDEVLVLVSEALAEEVGIQVGENYLVYTIDETITGQDVSTSYQVRVAGIWHPNDPLEAYWIFNPKFLNETFLVSEKSFVEQVSPFVPDEIYSGLWFFDMDGSEIHSSDANNLIRRILDIQQQVDKYLPNIRLSTSPADALFEYRSSANLLTVLLYAFSVPLLALVLAFVNLVAGLSIERQRNEFAVLRSRGATIIQILAIVLLEGLIIGVIALVISSPMALQIAKIMGQTRSFFDFSANADLRIAITFSALRAGWAAIGLAVITQLLPAIGAARHTIITYKQEQARLLRPPWWQRVWLDVMLFIPAAYGAYLLRNQGAVVVMESGDVSSIPFQNPLLFLVPALGIFSLTLFFLRFIPPIMTGLAWLAGRTKSVGLVLAARHLARTPGFYTTPLILLVLTLSLSAFTATLAKTLDDHLKAQVHYKIGANMRFFDFGESTSQSSVFAPIANETDENGPKWLFVPVSEYLKAPGIEAATRIGQYPASFRSTTGGGTPGLFLGVDRLDFPRVAYWRRDFASVSLGALMNNLAVVPEGILVSEEFLREHELSVGDSIRLFVDTVGQRNDLVFQIVGAFRLFPTWYPEDGPLFVGNLDYVFEQAGSLFPYRIWLTSTAEAPEDEQIFQALREHNASILNWQYAPNQIADLQSQPERQGLFGVLSIGFAAAAILTVLGFLLYALFSFQRRVIELGVLRASGLSSGQMTAYLAWELIFLITIGGTFGTVLGAWVSDFFIPFLQIGVETADRYPPFLVEIAWPAIFQIYVLFGVLFVVTLIALVVLLRRMRIFQAIKLGEVV